MASTSAHASTLLQRGIRRGIVTLIREHDWLTALGALTGVLLLVQTMVFLLLSMESAEILLKSRIDLRLEFLEGAKDEEIQTFLTGLHGSPYVSSYQYITKEQAYAQMQEHDPELIAFVEKVGMENPFPETVVVTLTSVDDYTAFSTFLQQEQWSTVVDPSFLSKTTDQESYVEELIHLTRTGRSLTIAFLFITGGMLLFVTTELVRGRVLRRSEEILIQHLSGAYPATILLPFIVETTLLLTTATFLSILLLGGLLSLAPSFLPPLTQNGIREAFGEHFLDILWAQGPYILLLELFTVPLIGLIGTWLGTLPKINSRALVLHRH